MSTRKRRFLPGYSSSLQTDESKKRYREKLSLIGNMDPYESEWLDDVDL
jgi:hypothetical protein